jgi:uncharacterized membrane protein
VNTIKTCSIILLLLQVNFIFVQAQETDYLPISLNLRILTDGSVFVQYAVESDPSQARIDVSVFGSPRSQLVIRDDENNPLASTADGTIITVDSLGALELYFSYITTGLTTKEGPLWNINVTSTIETRIILPSDATIFDLSQIPISMGTTEGKQYIDMPSGDIAVYYILGLPNPEEDAQNAILEAEDYLNNKELQGFILLDAISILVEAKSLYTSGNYLDAESKAKEAINEAERIILQADKASKSLGQAIEAINQAVAEGRTEGLSDIQASLLQAQRLYEQGDYLEAESLAELISQQALVMGKPSGRSTFYYLGVLIVILGIGGGYYYFRKRQGDVSVIRPGIRRGKNEVNLEKIFTEHQDLRLEDKELIRYLAENSGEAFATEIRDRFDLPRSSAWRLMRRLQKEGIVEEKKIGNQSLIRILEQYFK